MRTPARAVAFSLVTWWYHRLGLEVYALSFNITKKKKKSTADDNILCYLSWHYLLFLFEYI